MKFLDAYETKGAPGVLYKLLSERPRESWISHAALPSADEHYAFVATRPFRYWYLIEAGEEVGTIPMVWHSIGALECTDLNEIGIHIFRRWQTQGYGSRALKMFIERHQPLPAIPAKRNGHWLANVAPSNAAGRAFFAKHGFRTIQETMCLSAS